jgi:glutamate-1-semialdehyde 2,1-aminomutase
MSTPPSSYQRRPPNVAQSEFLATRAKRLVPALAQTQLQGPTQLIDSVAPRYLARGAGAHVWDVDGNEYIDLSPSIGPFILGYCYPAVDQAVQRQLASGVISDSMHPLEVDVAEQVASMVPETEMVRFGKSGTDVIDTAVRLAREFTQREDLLGFGSTAWQSRLRVTALACTAPELERAPEDTTREADTDAALLHIDDRTAAIIVDASIFDAPNPSYLNALRQRCDQVGALLIFDETWTGFRTSAGGAQEFHGVRADLACFANSVANGMPLSVIAGRRDLMGLLAKHHYSPATLGGAALSLAAAQVTLNEIETRPVLERIARSGARIREAYNNAAAALDMPFTRMRGPDCRSVVAFQAEAEATASMRAFCQVELIRNGVLWTGIQNVCYAHSESDVLHIIAAFEDCLIALKRALTKGELRDVTRGIHRTSAKGALVTQCA